MELTIDPRSPTSPPLMRTRKETVYSHLKEAIIRHELKPKERIHEKIIAQAFGISTTPVREAIVKLEGEGWLTIDAHRRVTVRPLSILDLSEMYEVIGVLDGYATSLALKNINVLFLEEIERLTEEMQSFHKEKKLEDCLNTNIFIHLKIWEASRNKFLNENLRSIVDRIRMYNIERLHLYSKAGIMDQSLDGHLKLLRMFKCPKNKANVERFCRNHWAIYAELLQ